MHDPLQLSIGEIGGGWVIEQVSEGQYPANGIRHPYFCSDTRWLSDISERITRLYSAQ